MGSGYVFMSLPGFAPGNSLCIAKIIRPGASAPCLGPNGWQIAEYGWELKIIVDENIAGVLLTPEVVSHIYPSANYIVRVKMDGNSTIECIVHWRGVPGYRKEDASSGNNYAETYELDNYSVFKSETIIQSPSVSPEIKPNNFQSAPEEPEQGPLLDQAPSVGVTVERKKIRCPNPTCNQIIMSTFVSCPYCKTAIS